MSDETLADFEDLDRAQDLQEQVQRLQIQLKRSKAKTAELVEAVYQASKDARVVARPPVVPPKRDRRQKRAEAALLMLSDWHVGKETPSFNTEVAADRVVELGRKVEKLTEIERADHPVRECHALLGGDFIENLGIFPGQAYEVDSTMFAQLFAAANALEGLLTVLHRTFEHVHLWTQVGNHGRIGRRGENPREDNIDRLLYRIVHERFKDAKRMTWHHAQSWYTIVQIGEYMALLVHGDQIKQFGGSVPAYGIIRKANAWASGVLGVDFVDVMMGHFHQPLVVPLANGRGRAFVNPSIESDSAYAQEFMAATGTPGQRLFFVDPDKGRITSERVIWLD